MSEGDLEEMRRMDDGSKWFVKDPCGIACAIVTYTLVVYGMFTFFTVLLPPFVGFWSLINSLIFGSFAVLAVICHYKSMCTEPVSFPQTLITHYLVMNDT